MADVLVFARSGRSNAEGAFATCHCLTLPASEPGYYFWRDRATRPHHAALRVVRHQVAGRHDRRAPDQVHDLVRAAALLRSVARSIAQGAVLSRRRAVDREARHGRARAVSHRSGAGRHPPHRARGRHLLRQLPRPAVLRAGRRDGARLSRQPARRRPSTISCATISRRSKRSTAASSATSFRTFPSFPQRYIERLAEQLPCEADADGVNDRAAARAAAADALHRGRSPHPAVHEGRVAAPDPEGRFRRQVSQSSESAFSRSNSAFQLPIPIHAPGAEKRGDQ